MDVLHTSDASRADQHLILLWPPTIIHRAGWHDHLQSCLPLISGLAIRPPPVTSEASFRSHARALRSEFLPEFWPLFTRKRKKWSTGAGADLWGWGHGSQRSATTSPSQIYLTSKQKEALRVSKRKNQTNKCSTLPLKLWTLAFTSRLVAQRRRRCLSLRKKFAAVTEQQRRKRTGTQSTGSTSYGGDHRMAASRLVLLRSYGQSLFRSERRTKLMQKIDWIDLTFLSLDTH
jgi:hypothetical protein